DPPAWCENSSSGTALRPNQISFSHDQDLSCPRQRGTVAMRQLLLWPVATSDNLVASAQIARRWSRTFEPEILVGRRVGVAPDQVDPGLLDPRTDAPDERGLVDRHGGRAILEDPLERGQV